MKKEFVPEFLYEEGSMIPFVDVPPNEEMPAKFMVFEYKQTGKFEPAPDGSEAPICDMFVHMYFNYAKAKEVLTPELLDQVRVAFDLEPLKIAEKKGQAITEKVMGNIGGQEDEEVS